MKKHIWSTGKNNKLWKGDSVGYCALHQWVYRNKGKANKCENTECSGKSTKYNWANISREYKRDISDWISLCMSCHYYFDNMGLKRWKGHIKNENKKCHCGRQVMSRELCSLHYNRMNMQERGLLCA